MGKQLINVMVDIETTGIKPGCGIWQIGACTSINGAFITFDEVINPNVIDQDVFKSDSNTIKWQYENNLKNYQAAFTNGKYSMEVLLLRFVDWLDQLKATDADLAIWCKGTDFDFPILEYAFKVYDIITPWKYSQVRDLRTLCKVLDSPVPYFPGAHDALFDAIHQYKHLTTLLARINTHGGDSAVPVGDEVAVSGDTQPSDIGGYVKAS